MSNYSFEGTPVPIVPSLGNSWVDYGAGFTGAQYYKDKTGLVTIEGVIKDGTDGTVFTLPAGFRPSGNLMFINWSAGGAFRIDVESDGDVVFTSSNSFFSTLAGVQFYATQ